VFWLGQAFGNDIKLHASLDHIITNLATAHLLIDDWGIRIISS